MTTPGMRGFRVTTARRDPGQHHRPTVRLVAFLAVLAILTIAVVCRREPPPEVLPPTPRPTQPPRATPSWTPTATATATRSPTPTPTLQPWTPTPTETPRPFPTFPPRPTPAPTPRPSECAVIRWSAGQNVNAVLVQIDVTNRCRYDLGQLDIFFRITGWRDGGVVQSVLGHPLTTVRRGHTEFVAVNLPGSLDWYDDVTLEVLDGAP